VRHFCQAGSLEQTDDDILRKACRCDPTRAQE
jgi:hypothetical protein